MRMSKFQFSFIGISSMIPHRIVAKTARMKTAIPSFFALVVQLVVVTVCPLRSDVVSTNRSDEMLHKGGLLDVDSTCPLGIGVVSLVTHRSDDKLDIELMFDVLAVCRLSTVIVSLVTYLSELIDV